MVVTCKAIVLSSVKYADNDLIVKCFTEIGLRSYLLKNIFRSKKGRFTPAFFLPLTQLELTSNYANSRSLHFLTDARIAYPYITLLSDVRKQTLALFLSETIVHILKEDEENRPLFDYFETSFKWLDKHEHIGDFHLVFLTNFLPYLGIYPEHEKNNKSLYFDMLEGVFTDKILSNYFISGDLVSHFIQLLNVNFETIQQLRFSRNVRMELLETLLRYLELHISGFKRPRSLDVLKSVFG